MAHRFFIGTSGWVYRHWRGVFYPRDLPQRDWFPHFARYFSTVEINNTFYRLPKESTWEHWRDEAPSGFRYAVKGSRYVTHIKRLRDCEEPVQTFIERALLLKSHLGPVLWQLPPQMRYELDRLEAFLKALPGRVHHVVEFRNDTWFRSETFAALRHHNIGFCAYHMVDEEAPLETTSGTAYVRFHGSSRSRKYEGRYTDRELAEWADRLRALPKKARDVYLYFNNDAEGYAIENANTLRGMLREAGEDAV